MTKYSNEWDFQEKGVLAWLAELMKYRDAADSRRYRMLVAKFIEKYGIDTSGYDVIKGWRANASYFYIAEVNNNIIDTAFLSSYHIMEKKLRD